MAIDIDRSVIGQEFDHTVLDPISETDIREYIAATGETHPLSTPADLIAPPTFVVRVRGRRFMPASMVHLGRAGLDAGKDIELGVPIRPGDALTASGTVHDIYEKTGRSGTMSFIVLRTSVTNQHGEPVAVIDQRMMFR